MNALRQWLDTLPRLAGLGREPAEMRAGPGFRGILDATLADIPEIVRFEMPIFQHHEEQYPYDFQISMDERQVTEKYEKIVRSPDSGAAMYVADASAVGYVSWTVYDQVKDRQAVVLSIAVEPGYRGQGLGRALLAYARERAEASGAESLRAHVWAHNVPSRAFFEAQGFTPVHTVYNAPVAAPGPPEQRDASS